MDNAEYNHYFAACRFKAARGKKTLSLSGG
jgi:hypothetical protein